MIRDSKKRGGYAQRGFSIVTAIFLIVVLGLLGVFIVTVVGMQQQSQALDVQGVRAYHAARAGIEWGAYQLLRDSGGAFTATCNGGTATSNLTFGDFTATVTCTAGASLSEGASTVRAYRIVSNGCNQPACPTVTTSATYVERELAISITSN